MPDPVKRALDDLRAAGAPSFFERDPAKLKAAFKTKFEAISGRTLYPAQTEMFLIEVAAYALSILHEAAQTATIQNTAVFASERHLEDRGANVSTFRLLAQPSKTTIRFTMSEVRLVDVVVPRGTRVASGNTIVFAIDADLIIPAGILSGAVTATAQTAGATWNGLAIGAVSDMLDPVAYVTSAHNIAVVAGGTDIESEERFRLRVVNALFTIAKTGPRNGYREHVMAVDPEIVDVAVIRPEPGHINIYPLMKTGLPSAALRDAVLAYLDPETLRPQGDYVQVLAPEPVDFSIGVNVRTQAANSGLQAAVAAAVTAAFRPWTSCLGSQISPATLLAAAMAVPGVVDASATGIAFTDLAGHRFARLAGLTVNVTVTPDV